MNKVIDQRLAKALAPKAKATAQATPAASAAANPATRESMLFRDIGDMLTMACGTPEQHACSGESDRLLTIAAVLATTAARKNGSTDDAFDIVACINAARLVPGDAESRERTKYIDAAAGKLAIILECQVGQVLRKGVKRPAHPQEGPPSNDFTANQLKQLYNHAWHHMECAKYVLDDHAERLQDGITLAARDMLTAFCDSASARLELEEVGNLLAGSLPDLSRDLEIALSLLECLAVSKDDGVLHGVAHLLYSAQRIAEGDKGVLA